MPDVLIILSFLIVAGVVLRSMVPEERERLGRAAIAVIRRTSHWVTHRTANCERLRTALRIRTRWVLITPVLVVLNITIFGFMFFGAGALSDPATLVGWGGSFGPRTTNGEWWRLLTSMFVHAGMLHLVVDIVALAQIGLILERLVGHLTFAAMYIAAGVFAGLVSLAAHPLNVTVGASGAIFGLYGLLLAAAIWGMLPRSSVTIPLTTVQRLVPAAAVFLLYNMSNDSLTGAARLTTFVAGFVYGLVLARGIADRKPPARRVAIAMMATAVIIVATAVTLRGIIDARPEIERVVAVEDRTAGAYGTAVDQFRKGRISAAALVQLIDRSIMPELEAADARLKALNKVPKEHQPLVAGAKEYVRLRSESWRLRADGLRKVNVISTTAATERASGESSRAEARYKATMRTLGQAESTERASLAVLEKIRPAKPQ